MDKRSFVISLGGSLLYDSKCNLRIYYLDKLISVIKKFYDAGYYFAIVVGGGCIARKYQEILSFLSNEDKDLIGIRVTHLNAEIVRAFFGAYAYKKILTDYSTIPKTNKILIGGGWLPGSSTDYDAVYLAKKLKIKTFINLTNVDGLFLNNQLVTRISYDKLLSIIPKWQPGLHFPIDREAVKLAMQEKIKIIIVNGNNLSNFKNILLDKDFTGTIIQ